MNLEGMLPIELIERRVEIERAIDLNVRTIRAYEQNPSMIQSDDQAKIDVLTDGILSLEMEYKELTGGYYNVQRT